MEHIKTQKNQALARMLSRDGMGLVEVKGGEVKVGDHLVLGHKMRTQAKVLRVEVVNGPYLLLGEYLPPEVEDDPHRAGYVAERRQVYIRPGFRYLIVERGLCPECLGSGDVRAYSGPDDLRRCDLCLGTGEHGKQS